MDSSGAFTRRLTSPHALDTIMQARGYVSTSADRQGVYHHSQFRISCMNWTLSGDCCYAHCVLPILQSLENMMASAKKIGVIMLNTQFPRLPGDIGNPGSFNAECEIVKLDKSRVENIVHNKIEDELANEIQDAALTLEARGCGIVTTSCGFLGPLQGRISRSLSVPFISSSLILIPLLQSLYGAGSKIGVLTFDSRRLLPQHFMGHYGENLFIAGIEQGRELYRVINNNESELDRSLAQADVIDAASRLIPRGVSCLLLECTNFSPYKPALRETGGLAVYDLVEAVNWLAGSVAVTSISDS